jgi:hypothetical protein
MGLTIPETVLARRDESSAALERAAALYRAARRAIGDEIAIADEGVK